MNWRIIGALVGKDLTLHFRNRFFAIITVLGIALYIVVYFVVMPKSVDETLEIGLYAPVMLPILEQMEGEGLALEVVESEEILKEGVTEGQYVAGIALPTDIMDGFITGQKPVISVYFASDVLEEIKGAVIVLLEEMVYQQVGQPLAIEVEEEILGPDLAGMQVPPRDRMRPLFAIFLIMTETFGLASLVTEELEQRTASALLVTPVSIKEFFTAKVVMGGGLAFMQAALLMAIIGGMNREPLIILTTMLLGALLVTGVSFIIAAFSKNFMSVLVWGMLVLIVLFIPAFGIMFPGAVTGWVKAIPSYYLVDTIHQVANFSMGWGDVWFNLVVLLGVDLVLGFIGIMVLKRRL